MVDIKNPLDTEMFFFEKNKTEWLKHNKGQIALIKGEQLIGMYSTFDLAVQEGIKRFGAESFLVKQVLDKEPIIQTPALSLGLLYARL